jgi:hypothetical protein
MQIFHLSDVSDVCHGVLWDETYRSVYVTRGRSLFMFFSPSQDDGVEDPLRVLCYVIKMKEDWLV